MSPYNHPDSWWERQQLKPKSAVSLHVGRAKPTDVHPTDPSSLAFIKHVPEDNDISQGLEERLAS